MIQIYGPQLKIVSFSYENELELNQSKGLTHLRTIGSIGIIDVFIESLVNDSIYYSNNLLF